MTGGLFSKILVPVDFSPCSEEAFRMALWMATVTQADIVLLHAIDTSAIDALNRLGLLSVPSDTSAQKKRLRHHARLNVRRLLETVSLSGVSVRRVIVEGTPFAEIAKTARAEKVDLVVIGSYGGRADRMDKIFFGSTAEKVVRTAGCPILTVPLPSKPSR
jgi:nucleotide-binding universal stress UspA family protein